MGLLYLYLYLPSIDVYRWPNVYSVLTYAKFDWRRTVAEVGKCLYWCVIIHGINILHDTKVVQLLSVHPVYFSGLFHMDWELCHYNYISHKNRIWIFCFCFLQAPAFTQRLSCVLWYLTGADLSTCYETFTIRRALYMSFRNQKIRNTKGKLLSTTIRHKHLPWNRDYTIK